MSKENLSKAAIWTPCGSLKVEENYYGGGPKSVVRRGLALITFGNGKCEVAWLGAEGKGGRVGPDFLLNSELPQWLVQNFKSHFFMCSCHIWLMSFLGCRKWNQYIHGRKRWGKPFHINFEKKNTLI